MGNFMFHPVSESEKSSGSMGSRINRLAGGVKVPSDEKFWAQKLVKDFAKFDYQTQVVIIRIIKEIGSLNPDKARKVGRWMEEYFRGITAVKNPQELIDRLEEDLEFERKKKVQ